MATKRAYAHFEIYVNVDERFCPSNEALTDAIGDYLELEWGAQAKDYNITLCGPDTVVRGKLDTSDE